MAIVFHRVNAWGRCSSDHAQNVETHSAAMRRRERCYPGASLRAVVANVVSAARIFTTRTLLVAAPSLSKEARTVAAKMAVLRGTSMRDMKETGTKTIILATAMTKIGIVTVSAMARLGKKKEVTIGGVN